MANAEHTSQRSTQREYLTYNIDAYTFCLRPLHRRVMGGAAAVPKVRFSGNAPYTGPRGWELQFKCEAKLPKNALN